MDQANLDKTHRILLIAVITLLTFGTIFFHFQEGFGWLDAYYFCVISLATVGYGDFHPVTALGKFVTTFYVLSGIGILTLFVSTSAKRRGLKILDRRKKHRD